MKEEFSQSMKVPVSLMEFLLQTQGTFGGFLCLKFYIWNLKVPEKLRASGVFNSNFELKIQKHNSYFAFS